MRLVPSLYNHKKTLHSWCERNIWNILFFDSKTKFETLSLQILIDSIVFDVFIHDFFRKNLYYEFLDVKMMMLSITLLSSFVRYWKDMKRFYDRSIS